MDSASEQLWTVPQAPITAMLLHLGSKCRPNQISDKLYLFIGRLGSLGPAAFTQALA